MMTIFKAFAALTCIAAFTLSGTANAGKANDTLIWTSEQEVLTVDPYYGQVRAQIVLYNNVCDGLINRNPETFEFEPHLAKAFRWVDDTTLEFNLRDDVVFHNGKPFSAEDVVYTYNHVVKPESGVLAKRNVSWMKSAEAIDKYTVRIHLKKAFPPALEYLSGSMPILPKGHYDNAPELAGKGRKDYGAVPVVCTGPYKIVRMVPGDFVELIKNDQYFGGSKGQPAIKHVVFRTITDRDVQIAELLIGNIDWIQDVPRDYAKELAVQDRVTVVQSPTLRIRFLRYDLTDRSPAHPFKDIRVRRAVSHAINKKALSAELVGGASQVLDSFCYPTQFGCTSDVPKFEYDVAKAKALLAEAGYPNGFETDLYAWRERNYTEAIVNDLAKIGIRARVRFMQWKAVRPLMQNGKAYFSDVSWGSFGINDVSALPGYFLAGSADDGARDPDVIAWVKAGNSATDPKVRKEAYKKALVRTAEQEYITPLFSYAKFFAFNKELDFTPHVDDIGRFYMSTWE